MDWIEEAFNKAETAAKVADLIETALDKHMEREGADMFRKWADSVGKEKADMVAKEFEKETEVYFSLCYAFAAAGYFWRLRDECR